MTTRTRTHAYDPGELTAEIMADPKALKAYAIAKERWERVSAGPEKRKAQTYRAVDIMYAAVRDALEEINNNDLHPVRKLTVRLDKDGNIVIPTLALRFKAKSTRAPSSNSKTPRKGKGKGKAAKA